MFNVLRGVCLFLLVIGNSVYAGNTNIKCPVPSVHLKPEMFSISQHSASTYLKNNQTGFLWHVVINSDNLIIDRDVIERFLRANKSQEYAFEGPGGLGMSRYTCSYINPFPYKSSFMAGSNGN